jgi:hypothetical protein
MYRFWNFGVAILVGFALLAPTFASAHLDAGEDIAIGNYLIDFGYTPKQLTAGSRVDMVFNLVDDISTKTLSPAYAWVRLDNGTTTIFAGTLHPQHSNFSFALTLGAAGQYKLLAQFFDAQNDKLVEHTFTFPVQAAVPPQKAQLLPEVSTGTLLMVAAVLFLGALSLHRIRKE